MNSHEEIRRNLPAYCSGDLSPSEQGQIRDHLNSCPACRSELAELETVLRLLRTTPQLEPPPWLATRVMARVREQHSARSSWLRRIFYPLQIKLPLEAAALLVVCLTGWYLTRTVATELRQQPLRTDTFEQSAPPGAAAPEQPATDRGMQKSPLQPLPIQPQLKPRRPAAAIQPTIPEQLPSPKAPPSPSSPETPAGFAPPPMILKEEKAAPSAGAPPASLRSVPAEEPAGRMKDLAPENRKAFKDTQRNKAESPAPVGLVRGKEVAEPVSAVTIRLAPVNPDTAADRIREAVVRSGGAIIGAPSPPAHTVRIRISADRLPELQSRLEQLGRIVERTVPRSDSRQIEVTVTW